MASNSTNHPAAQLVAIIQVMTTDVDVVMIQVMTTDAIASVSAGHSAPGGPAQERVNLPSWQQDLQEGPSEDSWFLDLEPCAISNIFEVNLVVLWLYLSYHIHFWLLACMCFNIAVAQLQLCCSSSCYALWQCSSSSM